MIEVYFAVFTVLLISDSFVCYLLGWRYRLIASIIFAALWPISMPLLLLAVNHTTRDCPKPDTARLTRRVRRWARRDD